MRVDLKTPMSPAKGDRHRRSNKVSFAECAILGDDYEIIMPDLQVTPVFFLQFSLITDS